MNLGSAFLIAGSGLAANGRATAVVSANVANALTDGYGRREAVMSQAFPGALSGVKVDSVARQVDMTVVQEARLAGASASGAGLLAAFATLAETALGQPGDTGALTTSLTQLETAFAEAAARPDNVARLSDVRQALSDVAKKMRGVSDTLQEARLDADRGIAADVEQVNESLNAVARMDTQIITMAARGEDTGALRDERQRVIDIIAAIVPVREVPRPDSRAALVTTGGLILLDGRVAKLGFTSARAVEPAFSQAGGELAEVTVDGKSVAMNAQPGLLDGGTLSARFAIRDIAAPEAQAALDTLARDLVERLSDSTLDPTNPVGAPGLLTDNGAAFNPARETGLASRLEVNPLVDPDVGGALFRLRDGLGAVGPGQVGNGALFTRATTLLGETRQNGGIGISSGFRTLQDLAGDVQSFAATRRLVAERKDSAAAAESATLQNAVAANGVNTDAEMQRLLALEQAYAANARVLSVVDGLFAELLEAVR